MRVEGCAINDATTFHANRAASARAFVHSLNILIKYARMYGPDHKRTALQFETAWNELQQGLARRRERAAFCSEFPTTSRCWMEFRSKRDRRKSSFGQLLEHGRAGEPAFFQRGYARRFRRAWCGPLPSGLDSKAQDVAKQIKGALGAAAAERARSKLMK